MTALAIFRRKTRYASSNSNNKKKVIIFTEYCFLFTLCSSTCPYGPHVQLCAMFSTTAESAADCLLQWLDDSKVEGLANLSIRKSEELNQTLGCFAAKDFSVGDVLFSIPQTCLLGYQDSASIKFIVHSVALIPSLCSSLVSDEVFRVWDL